MTPAKVKKALRLRASEGGWSGEWCEIQQDGCQGLGVDPAHRIGQKRGGRHRGAKVENNRLSNLMWACRSCHDWCHYHPIPAGALGWVLQEHQDPAAEKVLYRGEWRWLTDERLIVAHGCAPGADRIADGWVGGGLRCRRSRAY